MVSLIRKSEVKDDKSAKTHCHILGVKAQEVKGPNDAWADFLMMDISYSSTIRIPLYVDDFQDFHTFLVVSLDGLGILAKLNVNTKSSSSSKWNRRRVIIKMSIRNVRKLLRHADLLHLSVRLSIKSWVANFRNKKSAFSSSCSSVSFQET